MKTLSNLFPHPPRLRFFSFGKCVCLALAPALTTHTSAAEEPKPPSLGPEISLFSHAGQPYLGDQLKNFQVTGREISVEASPARLELLQTESREFQIRGDIYLGGTFFETPHPEDYLVGFTIFARETDPAHRYELNPVRLRNKRRLQEGKTNNGFIHSDPFPEPVLKKWLKFSVLVTRDEIVFEIGGESRRAPGPLDTDGKTFVGIAPKTKLRNLRLAFFEDPNQSESNRPIREEPLIRTWTSTDGRTLEGQLLFNDGTAITVRRTADHRILTIPLETLSAPDREFLSNPSHPVQN